LHVIWDRVSSMNTLSSACFVSAITATDASTMCLIKADRMDYRVLAFDIFRGEKSQPKEPEDYHGMFNHEYFIKSFESLLNKLATLGIQNAYIVMDNAKYHKGRPQGTPSSRQCKKTLQKM
ncbi:hypothetical protein DYB31_016041, partial [Aphanomyces astaci]